MADLRLTKNVLSGSSEYTVSVDSNNIQENDGIFITFDNDVILDDINILALDPALDIQLSLMIQYPTGATLKIANPIPGNITATTPYQLNDNGSDRNMWFRIPKWSSLVIFQGTVGTPGTYQISVIGRG